VEVNIQAQLLLRKDREIVLNGKWLEFKVMLRSKEAMATIFPDAMHVGLTEFILIQFSFIRTAIVPRILNGPRLDN
jgi:hypothetical protein